MTLDVDRLDSAFAGRYHVERALGAGGMAVVYLARDPKQDREVAIKVMRPEVASGLGAERFAREVAIAGGLAHPNIIPIFDSGAVVVDGVTLPFYAMPCVHGESLRARLARERQLPVEGVLRIARDIGEALDFAHAQGIVHRDVKPENILLVGDRAMLADFGVALAVEGATSAAERLTGTGIALGTPAYMSPEQAAGETELDGRTDNYALAVVAYEMLSGQLPFAGVTPSAIRARQLSGDVLPLAVIRPRAVTARMDETLARALAPTPADRFASAEEFVSALEKAHEEQARSPRRRAVDRRTRMLALGAVGIAIAAATVLAVRGVPPFGGASADDRLGVALMPFRAVAGAAEWSEALPDFVSTFLDGTPGVRVADPGSLWRPLRPTSDAPARSPDAEEADRLARRAGVRRFVLGSVVRSGARLDLSLRIYGVGMLEPVATIALFGSVDSIAPLAQRTAVELLQRVWEGESRPDVPRMESLLTQLPDALKAYLAAREAMHRGMADSADVAITRAIALDSSFALALLEAVSVRSWVQYARGQPYSGLRQLAARAKVHADSLTPRQRLRLEAAIAAIETDGSANASAWQRLLELDSTDLDANRGLAGAAMQYGWQFGATSDDVLRATERAVLLDSTDAPSLSLRTATALGRWDPDDVRRQLARLRALDSDAPLVRGSIRAIESLLADDAEFAARADSLADAPAVEWVGVFRMLRSYRPDRALLMAERTAARTTPGPMLELGVGARSGLLFGAGDVRAADAVWNASATGITPFGRLRNSLRIVAAALVGVEDSALTAHALQELAALVPIDSAIAYFDSRPSWQVAWSLGTWHAERGDTVLARRWLGIIPQFRAGGSPATWRESIATDIAARLAARRGAADSARVLTARAFELWTIHTPNTSDGDIEPALRFRHARALVDAGLRDSATRVLASFVPPNSWIGVYVPQAHLLLGALAERDGDRDRAARHYQEARELLALGGGSVPGLRARADSGAQRTSRSRLFRYGGAR